MWNIIQVTPSGKCEIDNCDSPVEYIRQELKFQPLFGKQGWGLFPALGGLVWRKIGKPYTKGFVVIKQTRMCTEHYNGLIGEICKRNSRHD